MPVSRFEITAIDAKKYSQPGEKHKNVRIDHNSSVTQVVKTSDKEASVEYRFTANYSGMGLIKIEGRLVFEGDAASLTSQWSENGQMPNDIANEIHNAVMSNCIPEAMFLARDLRLPPPVPLPKVNIGGPAGKAGGSAGGKGDEPSGYM